MNGQAVEDAFVEHVLVPTARVFMHHIGDHVEGIEGTYTLGADVAASAEDTVIAMGWWNRVSGVEHFTLVRAPSLDGGLSWYEPVTMPRMNGLSSLRARYAESIDAYLICDLFAIPYWAMGLRWRPGDVESPRRSARHAAYARRRRGQW